MASAIMIMLGEQACGLASSTASLFDTSYFAVRHARREKRRHDRYLL